MKLEYEGEMFTAIPSRSCSTGGFSCHFRYCTQCLKMVPMCKPSSESHTVMLDDEQYLAWLAEKMKS